MIQPYTHSSTVGATSAATFVFAKWYNKGNLPLCSSSDRKQRTLNPSRHRMMTMTEQQALTALEELATRNTPFVVGNADVIDHADHNPLEKHSLGTPPIEPKDPKL